MVGISDPPAAIKRLGQNFLIDPNIVHKIVVLAEQGNVISQYTLGVLYANGYGVPQDFVQAYKWYNLAAANGAEVAGLRRDTLAKQMIPAQIAEAQQLAREWKPKTP